MSNSCPIESNAAGPQTALQLCAQSLAVWISPAGLSKADKSFGRSRLVRECAMFCDARVFPSREPSRVRIVFALPRPRPCSRCSGTLASRPNSTRASLSKLVSLQDVECGMPINPSAFHHKINRRRSGDISNRIARHGDDVRRLSGSQDTQVVASQEFRCHACPCL